MKYYIYDFSLKNVRFSTKFIKLLKFELRRILDRERVLEIIKNTGNKKYSIISGTDISQ